MPQTPHSERKQSPLTITNFENVFLEIDIYLVATGFSCRGRDVCNLACRFN